MPKDFLVTTYRLSHPMRKTLRILWRKGPQPRSKLPRDILPAVRALARQGLVSLSEVEEGGDPVVYLEERGRREFRDLLAREDRLRSVSGEGQPAPWLWTWKSFPGAHEFTQLTQTHEGILLMAVVSATLKQILASQGLDLELHPTQVARYAAGPSRRRMHFLVFAFDAPQRPDIRLTVCCGPAPQFWLLDILKQSALEKLGQACRVLVMSLSGEDPKGETP